MNQFDLIQYGYLGLLAMMLVIGGRSVNTYLKSSNPPKYSILLIVLFFLLSITGGVFGFFWADKELKSSLAKKSTATIVESEIAKARDRLTDSLGKLYIARNKALEESVYGGNSEKIQELNRTSAMDITKMIELQEARYEEELSRITKAYSSIDNEK